MKRSSAVASIVGVSVLALVALVSGGCGSSVDDAAALEGKVWKASEIAGVTSVLATKGSQATAEFSAGRVSGSGTVNRFTAPYAAKSGNKISISAPASTQMAGPPPAMAQEQAYFAALQKASRYTVSADSLTLLDDQDAILVKYSAVTPTKLTGTQWEALAYNNGKGGLQSLAATSTITAMFATDGSLSGNASVNQYQTKYTTSEKNQMTIDAQIGATSMAGPEDLMTQEAAYLGALPKTATYTIEGDELWLRDAGGAALAHYVAK